VLKNGLIDANGSENFEATGGIIFEAREVGNTFDRGLCLVGSGVFSFVFLGGELVGSGCF